MVYLGLNILESLQLEVLPRLPEHVKRHLSLDELVSHQLGVRVPHIKSFGAILFLHMLELDVSSLQVAACFLSEHISYYSIDGGLGSVPSAVGEGLIWERHASLCVLKDADSEGNPRIIRLSKLVVVLGSYLAFDNCLFVQLHEVPGIF